MGRFSQVLVVLTLAFAAYWVVMTGYFAERAINLQVREARNKSTAADMADVFQGALDRTRRQHRLVESMGFLARNSDWTNLRLTERTLEGLLEKTKPGVAAEQVLRGTDTVETLKQELGQLKGLSVNAMGSSRKAQVTVAFWVCLIGAIVTWAAAAVQRATR